MAQRTYTGKPPIFQTTASVSAEYFHHIDRLYSRGYELVGISQLSATSQRPAGIESGEALRTLSDIGSRRFQHTQQRWEQFHLDVGELVCEAAKELQEDGVSVKVLAAGDKNAEELSFKDIDMERDRYILRPHPINVMPDTPAGKIETGLKLAQMAPQLGPYLLGMITGIPDLEYAVSMANAPFNYANELVCQILDHGKYTPPDGEANLPLTRDVAQRSLLRAKVQNLPEERIELLRRLIEDIDDLQARQEAAMVADQMAAGGGDMMGGQGGPAPEPGAVLGAPQAPLPPPMPMPTAMA